MSAPSCPASCAVKVPIVVFDICAPVTHQGQFQYLFMTNIGNPLNDVEDPAEWALRLSNSSVAADAIRKWHIIGDKPLATKEEKIISLNRKIYGVKDHIYNITVDETNDFNYEAMRELECGGTRLIWLQTSAGLIYGGNSGIESTVSLDDSIPRDIKALNEFIGTAKHSAQFHPDRNVSPIA